jgi:hypothetical protein
MLRYLAEWNNEQLASDWYQLLNQMVGISSMVCSAIAL